LLFTDTPAVPTGTVRPGGHVLARRRNTSSNASTPAVAAAIEHTSSYVSPATGDIWGFIEGVASWIKDPLMTPNPSHT